MRAGLLPPLRHPVARVLLVAFAVLHVALALASTGPTPATSAALILICAAAAIVVLPVRLPRLALPAVVAAPLTGTGLVLTTLHLEGWPGYAAWPLGAATFIALGLALRARRGAGWLLMGGLAVESMTWSTLEGAGPLPGVDLVVRHVGTLLLGTLFAVGLTRSAAAVSTFHDTERHRRAQVAVTAATKHQRIRSAEHLLDLAGPTLAALEQRLRPDPGALRALEGRLRDEMTAGWLLTEGLNAALDRARRRGVDVVLLADRRSGDPDDLRREQAAAWLIERVDLATPGRCVGRITATGSGIRISVQSVNGVESLELPRR